MYTALIKSASQVTFMQSVSLSKQTGKAEHIMLVREVGQGPSGKHHGSFGLRYLWCHLSAHIMSPHLRHHTVLLPAAAAAAGSNLEAEAVLQDFLAQ